MTATATHPRLPSTEIPGTNMAATTRDTATIAHLINNLVIAMPS